MACGHRSKGDCAGFDAAQAFMPDTTLVPDGDEQAGPGAVQFEVERQAEGTDVRACQAMCLSSPGCMAWRHEAKGDLFVDHGRCFRWGSGASLLREDGAAGAQDVVSGVRAGARVVKQGPGFARCGAAPAKPAR